MYRATFDQIFSNFSASLQKYTHVNKLKFFISIVNSPEKIIILLYNRFIFSCTFYFHKISNKRSSICKLRVTWSIIRAEHHLVYRQFILIVRQFHETKFYRIPISEYSRTMFQSSRPRNFGISHEIYTHIISLVILLKLQN